MVRFTRSRVAWFVYVLWFLCIVVVWLAARAWGAPAAQYTLTDLGPTAIPYALDRDTPSAVGVSEVAPRPLNFQVATRWDPGPTVLGTLPQGQWSDARGICGSIVVGESSTGPLAGLTHAYRKIGTGPLEDLERTDPANFSAATAVNCASTTVGYADVPGRTPIAPVVWTGAHVSVLPTPGGGDGFALAINQEGDIVGEYRTAQGETHCALWPLSGGIVDCHTPTVATTFSIGLGINTSGQVVGYATTAQGQRGFLWKPATGMIALPPLAGDTQSSAYALNDVGDSVGRSVLPPPQCCDLLHQAAVLWSNGQPIDLLPRVTNGQGWVFAQASSINTAGVIVGTGTLQGVPHGWLLTPVTPLQGPPPQAVTLLWRHVTTGQLYFWFLQGTTLRDSGSPGTVADLNWKIEGMGDFDGDGKLDILWRHAVTGQVYIWLMDGLTTRTAGSPGTVADLDWRIERVQDFNGDGKADILWRHRGTGQVFLWLMDGLTVHAYGSPGTVADPNWQIEGAGDVDGDGIADIVWRHGVTGEVVLWLLGGPPMQGARGAQGALGQ